MKYKFLFAALLAVVISSSAFAQFHQSLGIGIISGSGKVPKGAEATSEKPQLGGWGVFYHPRFNISETETSAISIGIPLTLGLTGSYNSREGGNMSLLVDLPLTVDYNFGAGSSEYAESGFGGFIGAGFGYTHSSNTDEFYIPGVVNMTEQVKGTSYGPLVNGGIRALIGEKTFFLRGFYKMGLEKAKFSTFGASVGLSF